MDPPCFIRRKKTAAERRAQRHRSEARFLQRALSGLNDVHSHRGGTLTRFGYALREALTHLSSGVGVPPSSLFGPSVPDAVTPCPDAVSAPSHGVPADVSVPASAHSFNVLGDKGLSMSISEVGGANGVPLFVSTQLHECPGPAVLVSTSTVPLSVGSGDEPDLMMSQQLVGTEVSDAVQHGPVQFPDSTPAVFPLSGKGAQSHCFFELADVRNFGAASEFALTTVQPLFYMVKCGLSFIQSELAVALEVPAKENKPNRMTAKVV